MKTVYSISACALMLLAGVACAQVRTAKSERFFNRMIQNAPFAVVMLYDEGKAIRKDRVVREQFDQMQHMFRSASAYSVDFKYADVAFIKADVSRRDIVSIADQYHVESFPTFLLFKDGHMVVDKSSKKRAQLTGFVSRAQLLSFIDKNLGDSVKNAAKEGRKRRAYYRSDGPYFSVGAGYPYPYAPYYGGYYGYPYGGYPYYGPGIGFSVGF